MDLKRTKMKLIVTLALFLCIQNLEAQTGRKADKPVTPAATKQDSLIPAKTTTFEEGKIPTPEEQGFTKYIIDGKEVYVKESPGIRIEYQPK